MISISKEELDKYRYDTTGCSGIVHFNNAGASLPPDIVIDTVIDYLREEATYGGYETEYKNITRIEDVYRLIADLIGANKDEVAIFENASAAWLTAFKGLELIDGDEIITCELEYISNLLALIDAQNRGVKVVVISNDECGNFPLANLEAAINERTRLIAVTHIPSSGGGILPVEDIGQIAAKHNVLYMIDACQTAGQYPIDVKALRCDILSATGRKYLRAPRGTGFLYIRKQVQDRIRPMLLDQHAARNVSLEGYELRHDARRFELYEKSRALTLGLGAAIEYALAIDIDRIWERVQSLASYAREQLKAIPGLSIHDVGDQQCGIVTFSVKDFDSMELRNALVERGINVSFGSRVATLIYMNKRQIDSLVRASLHYYNTDEEVLRMCSQLREILRQTADHVE